MFPHHSLQLAPVTEIQCYVDAAEYLCCLKFSAAAYVKFLHDICWNVCKFILQSRSGFTSFVRVLELARQEKFEAYWGWAGPKEADAPEFFFHFLRTSSARPRWWSELVYRARCASLTQSPWDCCWWVVERCLCLLQTQRAAKVFSLSTLLKTHHATKTK